MPPILLAAIGVGLLGLLTHLLSRETDAKKAESDSDDIDREERLAVRVEARIRARDRAERRAARQAEQALELPPDTRPDDDDDDDDNAGGDA